MRKYWFVFWIYWQEGLSQRASFLMERLRSVVLLVSFYYLWSALLVGKTSFAGYDRSQMITYILGMNIVRSVVFASRTYEIAGEINHGRLSAYLLKPINFIVYTFFRDLAEKSINIVSAIIEVCVLAWIFHAHLALPAHLVSWLLFIVAIVGAIGLNFLMTFAMGCWGFWTAESDGPRFCFELFLEFSAGAFFPLDVLPSHLQTLLKSLPSPYLVFFPLQIFLEKLNSHLIIEALLIQMCWLLIFLAIASGVWQKGIRIYGAEGG